MKDILINLMNYQFTYAITLLAIFGITLYFKRRILVALISVSFILIGLIMTLSGLGMVKGFEGMGVSMAGIIYGIIGLSTLFIMSLEIYYRSKKVSI
ncbi:hypothetical protein [Neobacillus sp. LXY-4]|uniref:hypothetical protein n=1 Tax=Neobacillus sp. LXY-4 TaxID=3379826 RepID=UPI003EE0EE6A